MATSRTEIKQFPNKYTPVNGIVPVVVGPINTPVTSPDLPISQVYDFNYIITVTPIIAEYYTQSSVGLRAPYIYKPYMNKFNGNNIVVNTNPFGGSFDISSTLSPYVNADIGNLTYSTVKEDNYGIVKYTMGEGYSFRYDTQFYALSTFTASGTGFIDVSVLSNRPVPVKAGEFIRLSKTIKNVDSFMDNEFLVTQVFPGVVGPGGSPTTIRIRYSYTDPTNGVIIIYPPPTRTDTGIITNVRSSITPVNSNVYYAYNGVRQFYDKDKNFADKYLIRDAYAVSSIPTKALSLYDNYKEIGIDDYEFVNFLMDYSLYPANRIQLVTYDLNKNVIGTSTAVLTYLDTSNKLWTCPVGPLNLSAVNGTFNSLINNANVVYYDVVLKFQQSSPFPIDNTLMIVKRKINRNCTKSEPIRLAWLNELGGFEFYTFKAANKHTRNINRVEYNNSLPYNYSTTDRMKTTLAVEIKETYTANTDYISKEDYDALESLFSSPSVYYINKNMYGGRYSYGENIVPSVNPNTYYLPVNITSNSYTSKSLYDDTLFQVSIDFIFGFDKNVQGT